jgi:hypothetical protein
VIFIRRGSASKFSIVHRSIWLHDHSPIRGIRGEIDSHLLNTEIIPVRRAEPLWAPEAYKTFHDESPKNFVIDPRNTTKMAA